MRISNTSCRLALLVAVAGMIAQPGTAQQAAAPAELPSTSIAAESSPVLAHFQRGYYLQTLAHQPAEAAAAFEKVLADASAPAALRADAAQRLAECREDIAAADPASLLPGNAIAYLEINRPGEHVGSLLKSLGLIGARTIVAHESKPGPASNATPNNPPASSAPNAAEHSVLPLDGPFVVPRDFAISPALVRELAKVRGIAAAITSIDRDGIPDGVLVIHPGESDLLRGLAETGIQFVPPADAVAGFKTYQIDNEVWVVQTARLFVIGRTKSQVAAAVARLGGKATDSLAAQKPFAALTADRQGALLFAYVAGDQIASIVMSNIGIAEAMVARSVADLDHLESISASARITDTGLAVQLKTNLGEGHRNLAYALIRTAPATRRTLASVPAGVAAVGILGLNPADTNLPRVTSDRTEPRYVTAMDLGREVFANVEEISMFVLPNSKSDLQMPLPDVGLVFGVKDPNQSEALWDLLLSLPSMFGAPLTSPPKDVTIEGVKGREFQFPFIPPIVLVAQKDRTFVAGTRGAVIAALAVAAGKQESLAKDPQIQPLVDALPKNTSKAAIVHFGRTMRIVGQLGDMEVPPEVMAAHSVFDQLTLSLVTDELPTQLALRVEAKGLPDVMQLVRMAIDVERGERARYSSRIRASQAQAEAAKPSSKELSPRVESEAVSPQR